MITSLQDLSRIASDAQGRDSDGSNVTYRCFPISDFFCVVCSRLQFFVNPLPSGISTTFHMHWLDTFDKNLCYGNVDLLHGSSSAISTSAYVDDDKKRCKTSPNREFPRVRLSFECSGSAEAWHPSYSKQDLNRTRRGTASRLQAE